MENHLKGIESINWSRNSKTWKLRAIGQNGRILTNKKAIILIANVIKQTIGLELTPEEYQAENELKEIYMER